MIALAPDGQITYERLFASFVSARSREVAGLSIPEFREAVLPGSGPLRRLGFVPGRPSRASFACGWEGPAKGIR